MQSQHHHRSSDRNGTRLSYRRRIANVNRRGQRSFCVHRPYRYPAVIRSSPQGSTKDRCPAGFPPSRPTPGRRRLPFRRQMLAFPQSAASERQPSKYHILSRPYTPWYKPYSHSIVGIHPFIVILNTISVFPFSANNVNAASNIFSLVDMSSSIPLIIISLIIANIH